MRSLLILVALVGYVHASHIFQETFGTFPSVPEVRENVTTMYLSELGSTGEFTTLSHPRFPFHHVRIKKTKFCDPTVKFVPQPVGETRTDKRQPEVLTPDTLTLMLAQSICSSTSSRVAAIQKKVNAFTVSYIYGFSHVVR